MPNAYLCVVSLEFFKAVAYPHLEVYKGQAVISLPSAVLFDFDGTLVDSAPDLAGAVNDLRVERGLPLLPFETLRPYATYGARSLLKAGLGLSLIHI